MNIREHLAQKQTSKTKAASAIAQGLAKLRDGKRMTFSVGNVHAHVWFDEDVARTDFGDRNPDSGEWQVIFTTSPDPLNLKPRGKEITRETFRYVEPKMRSRVLSSAEKFIHRGLGTYSRRYASGQKQAAGFKLRWNFDAKDRGNPVRRVQSPNGDGEYTVWDDAYGKIHWTLQKPGVSTGLGSPSSFRSWNAATQDAENHALGRGRWRSNRTAARTPGGLYGFTKQTQNDCETASRAVQRAASRIARRIYAKDQETAPFLSTHSRRSKSMAAKILTAAMSDLGPKIASVNYGQDNALRTRLAELREQRGLTPPPCRLSPR